MTRRTFDISEEVSDFIDSMPGKDKSAFVTQALKKAMIEAKKSELIDLIDKFDTGTVSDKTAVDMIREIRESEFNHLNH